MTALTIINMILFYLNMACIGVHIAYNYRFNKEYLFSELPVFMNFAAAILLYTIAAL